jgi:membrane protein required for colicin V production
MPQLVKAWSAVGLDGSLLILCLISGVLAMYRGVTREVLTLANWVIAGAAAALMFQQRPLAEDLGTKYGQNPTLILIGMTAIVFLLSLIIVYVITGRFADRVLDSRVGMIDRLLGFGFGVLRGILLVVIAFMFYTKFFPISKDQAVGIPNARSIGFVQGASERLQTMLEPLVAGITKKFNTRDGEEPTQSAPAPRG